MNLFIEFQLKSEKVEKERFWIKNQKKKTLKSKQGEIQKVKEEKRKDYRTKKRKKERKKERT